MAEVLSMDEIDQLLTSINTSSAEPEAFKPNNTGRKIKMYDFKRPDKFSKDQLRNISIIHETFARLTAAYTSAKCRTICSAHIASVDQLTYEEFIRSIPTPTTLAVVNMKPLNGYAVMEIDPACTFEILDYILGGCGGNSGYRHELTDIEKSIMEGVICKLIDNLREAWMPVMDLQPKLEKIDTNPQFVQIVPPTEMVVLVTIEFKICEAEGMLNICIPYKTVESIMGKLGVDGICYQRESNTNKNNAQKIDTDNFDELQKTVKAEYFRKEMTIEQLSTLLDSKGTILIEDQNPYTGQLFMNDVCIGEFGTDKVCGCKTEGSHIKINILKKECKLEKNYMDKKNNVLESSGTLKDVKVQVIAELGRTVLSLGEVSSFAEGTILELDKFAGEPVDLYANNVKIALGEVVVIDEKFGIRITEIAKETV